MKRSVLVVVGLALLVAQPAAAQEFGCFGSSGNCKTVIKNGREQVVCCGPRQGAARPRDWERPRGWDGPPRRWETNGCFGRSGDYKTVTERGRQVVVCCR